MNRRDFYLTGFGFLFGQDLLGGGDAGAEGEDLSRHDKWLCMMYPRLMLLKKLLAKDGIKTRIVSVPSEGLFRTQSKEYQESILPTGAKIFGLTAGIPANLFTLVGVNGKVWGMESFGYSAPFKVLDEKLGFNAENVYNQVKEML